MSSDQTVVDLESIKARVAPLIEEFVDTQFDVILTSLCTEDGFVIHHKNAVRHDVEGDKMAAVASALLSIAEASVQSVSSGQLRVTIIESDNANLFVMRTSFKGTAAVLTVACSRKLSVGRALFLVNRLAAAIQAV